MWCFKLFVLSHKRLKTQIHFLQNNLLHLRCLIQHSEYSISIHMEHINNGINLNIHHGEVQMNSLILSFIKSRNIQTDRLKFRSIVSMISTQQEKHMCSFKLGFSSNHLKKQLWTLLWTYNKKIKTSHINLSVCETGTAASVFVITVHCVRLQAWKAFDNCKMTTT